MKEVLLEFALQTNRYSLIVDVEITKFFPDNFSRKDILEKLSCFGWRSFLTNEELEQVGERILRFITFIDNKNYLKRTITTMIKDKIKKLMRPADSNAYDIALANSIYNTAIRDVLELLDHNDDDDSVRKETAKEIYTLMTGEYEIYISHEIAKEIAERFGVEVEDDE